MTKTAIITLIILITIFFASCSNPITPVTDFNSSLMSEETGEPVKPDTKIDPADDPADDPAYVDDPADTDDPADNKNKGPGNNSGNGKDNGNHYGWYK